ncbi:L-aspartate oxidase [Lysinibacillus sp. 54212]|uniref:L-aspartate oxidase n=1 Tax=Lysinibacillus sp. 54212 TaxID=3119829 RepID=UPI002FC9D892
MNISTDIVIIGGGIAALEAARNLSRRFHVHIITKSDLTVSSSYKAQGGIAAVISADDDTALHIQDTLKAGEYHHHEGNVKALIENGASVVKELLQEGFQADHNEDGEISLGLEGAHSKHRIVHAGGDATGKNLVDYIAGELPPNVYIHTYEFAYELLLNSAHECCGVRVKTNSGEKSYFASYVILATGGAGALYECTSNCETSYGDGIALAYLAGASVTDMEFVQFHPSLLYVNGARGLVSEAVRGAGGKFVDVNGKPIMDGKHPLGDLAPRHITAYEMYKMRENGQEVFIDISRIKSFEQKFPTIHNLCSQNGVDLSNGRIPIAPGSHFLMGGVITDLYGQTSIPRLFAVGEVACTGVHGANRLASNSLLEGITFGTMMATYLLENGDNQHNFILRSDIDSPISESLLPKVLLQKAMLSNAGIVRSKEGLQKLIVQLPGITSKTGNLRGYSKERIELYFMNITASLIAHAAQERTESRGAHIRNDYPMKANHWQKRWIVFEQGKMNVRNDLYECNQTKSYVN